MDEKELQTLEIAINQIASIVTDLTREKTEIEMRIEELERVRASLVRLLPPEKRIEKLI